MSFLYLKLNSFPPYILLRRYTRHIRNNVRLKYLWSYIRSLASLLNSNNTTEKSLFRFVNPINWFNLTVGLQRNCNIRFEPNQKLLSQFFMYQIIYIADNPYTADGEGLEFCRSCRIVLTNSVYQLEKLPCIHLDIFSKLRYISTY